MKQGHSFDMQWVAEKDALRKNGFTLSEI